MPVGDVGWSQVLSFASQQDGARQVVIDADADKSVQSRNAKKTALAQKLFSAETQDRVRYKSSSEQNHQTLVSLKTSLNSKFGDAIGSAVFQSVFEKKFVSYSKKNGDEVQTARPVSAKDITLADNLATQLTQAREQAVNRAGISAPQSEAARAHVEATFKALVEEHGADRFTEDKQVSTEAIQQFRDQLHEKLETLARAEAEEEGRFQAGLLYLELDNTQGVTRLQGLTEREDLVRQWTLQVQGEAESRDRGHGRVYPEVRGKQDEVRTLDLGDGFEGEVKAYLRGNDTTDDIQRERKAHFHRGLPDVNVLEGADRAIKKAKDELRGVPALERDLDNLRLLSRSGLSEIEAVLQKIAAAEDRLSAAEQQEINPDDQEALRAQLEGNQQVLGRLLAAIDGSAALYEERDGLNISVAELGRRLLDAGSQEVDLINQRNSLQEQRDIAQRRLDELLLRKQQSKVHKHSPSEKKERRALRDATIPNLDGQIEALTGELATVSSLKQDLNAQKASAADRRDAISQILEEPDKVRVVIAGIEEQLGAAQQTQSSSQKVRDEISALQTELGDLKALRNSQRTSFQNKLAEIDAKFAAAGRAIDGIGNGSAHNAEREAARAVVNLHALREGLITPDDLSPKDQEHVLSLIKIRIGGLNDALEAVGKRPENAFPSVPPSEVESKARIFELRNLERQINTSLRARLFDQFMADRIEVSRLSRLANDRTIVGEEKERRIREFYEARDTLVDQRAKLQPLIGKGPVTSVFEKTFIDSISEDAIASSLIKQVANRPQGVTISSVIDAASKALGAGPRKRIIDNLVERREAVRSGELGEDAFGEVEQAILEYLEPSQLQNQLSATLSGNGNTFASLFQRYGEVKSDVAILENYLAEQDGVIRGVEADIAANTNRTRRQKVRMGIEKFLGTHEPKAEKQVTLDYERGRREEAQRMLAQKRKLLNEYRPQVAVIAKAASRVPPTFWEEARANHNVREQLSQLREDPYFHAVFSAAQQSQLADHNRLDAGGIRQLELLFTQIPQEIKTEFAEGQ